MPARQADPLMEKHSSGRALPASPSQLAVCTDCGVNEEQFLPHNSPSVHKKSTSGWMNLSLKVSVYFLGHEGVWVISSIFPFDVKAGAFPQ